ncbi:GTP-binding protein [Prochlorococcus sp. MIT 1223]|uniref:GTP-binding protein n=1 Tax=Prochlorococcus sp. MIT 1223 TaxID=3096217 RepID=UPI002A752FC0|nr:GTPase [Prochlorococcus sp. MIT 1223]
MSNAPSIAERSCLLLKEWKHSLDLTCFEKEQLRGELEILDEQLDRLKERRLRISVFGRVGVGKSSLLNALLDKQAFNTNVYHGSTYQDKVERWNQSFKKLKTIELVDTPGIDEVSEQKRKKETAHTHSESDFILFVIDSDLTRIEIEALELFIKIGKPVLLVINRCDQWKSHELKQLQLSIKNRLPPIAKNILLVAVASAPRKSQLLDNGKVRSVAGEPTIELLRDSLIDILEKEGELFLVLNSLRVADKFYSLIKSGRLKRGKLAAQSLIGKFAALKASGVAASPLLILDLTAGLACDTALVIELSKLYGLQLQGPAARELLKRLSLYNSLLGGAQFSIQIVLGLLRQIFLLAAPLTGGISLTPALPIALAQAALAIHTTKLTGRLAAKEFLQGGNKKNCQPCLLLYRLARKEPEVKMLLNQWPSSIITPLKYRSFQSLLP